MTHHPPPRQHTNTAAHLRNMARRQGPAQTRRRARRALRAHLQPFATLSAAVEAGHLAANANGAPVELWEMADQFALSMEPDDCLPVNPRVAGWSHVCFIDPELLAESAS